ncbi:MAG: hypothetical protein WA964_21530, partial [Ilumatobacter sp.]
MKHTKRRAFAALSITLAMGTASAATVEAQTESAADNQAEAEAEVEGEVEAEVGDGVAAGAASFGAASAAAGDGSLADAMTSASVATSATEPAPNGDPVAAAADGLFAPESDQMVETETLSGESEVEAETEVEAEAGNGSAVAAVGAGASGSGASVDAFTADGIDGSTSMLAESATDARTSTLQVPYLDTPEPADDTSIGSAMQAAPVCETEGETPTPETECEDAANDEIEVEAEAEAEAETEMGSAAAGVSGAAGASSIGGNPFTDAEISTAVSTSTSDVIDVSPPFAGAGSDQFEVEPSEGTQNLSSESEVEVESEAEAEVANNAAAAAAVASGGAGQSGDGASGLVSASTATSTSTESDVGSLVRNNDERLRENTRVETSDLPADSTDADNLTEAHAEAEATAEISDTGVPTAFTESDATALGDTTATTDSNQSRADTFGSDDSRTPDQADFQFDTPAFVPFDAALAGSSETEVEAETEAEAEVEVGFNAAAASAAAVGGQARNGAGQMSGQALAATETNTKVFGNDASIVEDRGRAIDAGDETIPAGLEEEVEAEAEAEAEVGRGAAAAGAGAGFVGAPATEDFAVSDSQTTLFAAAAVAAAGPVTTFEIEIPEGDSGLVVATATATDPDCGGVAVAVAVAGVGQQADGSENELEGESEDECSASASVTIRIAGSSAIAEPGTASFTADSDTLTNPEGESEAESEVEVEAEAGNGVAGVSVAVATAGRFPQVSTSSSTSTIDVGASIYVPVTPDRVIDTRNDAGATALDAGDTVSVDVSDAEGVPDTGVTAVAMYVTMVQADGRGFATVYPAGVTRPIVSNVNTTDDGRTRGNLVIVPVDADGAINIYSSVGTQITADVVGYYQLAIGQVEGGRTITQTPERLFDTRTDQDPGLEGRVDAGETLDVDVLGEAGVPDSGVEAVIITLTAANTGDRGYVTAWSGDGARPEASSLNYERAGDVSANQTIVPLEDDGTISLFSFESTHLIADVTGYITDETADTSRSGLFVPLSPDRVFDTREEAADPGPKGRLDAGVPITPNFGEANDALDQASGVMLNVTAVNADDRGFVT